MVGGQDHHTGGGIGRFQLLQRRDPVGARHEQVQQHDVCPQPARCLGHGDPVDALADHLDPILLLEQEAKTLADHLVVVDEQYPDRTHSLMPASGAD